MKSLPPKRASFSPRRRVVTDQERLIWWEHTRNDEKYVNDEPPFPAIATEPVTQSQPSPAPRVAPAATRSIPAGAVPDIGKGDYRGVDARLADRFRKGKTVIDGRLDLHGHSRETAYVHVMHYIRQSYDMGRRNILIITGRGLFQKDKPVEERGVLRKLLPVWLNDPAVRNLILAYDQAQIKDGGEGAFYVLLKRKRK